MRGHASGGGVADFVVVSQQIRLIEPDCLRVLPDVIGIVDSARQTLKITDFNRVELPDAQLCGLSYRFQADAPSLPPVLYSENARLRHDARPLLKPAYVERNGTKSRFILSAMPFQRIQDYLSRY
jgi:hypothetical protein